LLSQSEFISILGPSHLIYITVFIIIAFLLFYFKSWVADHRNLLTPIILVVSLIQQAMLYGSYFVFYDFTLAESLPLQISRVSSILGIIFLISKNKKVYSTLTLFGLFALLSFLYPSRVHPITHPIGLSFLINHTITLLLPSYGMIAYNMKIQKGDRHKVYILFLIYVAFVYFLNPIVNGNYFYLTIKPIFNFLPDIIYIPLILIATYFYFMIGEWFYHKLYPKLSMNDFN